MEPREYLKFKNIQGYFISRYKWVGGRPVLLDKPVVVFLVKRKLPKHLVPKEELIPVSVLVEGRAYITDVLEIKPVSVTQPPTAAAQTVRVRPVPGGVSGASKTSSACTITGPFIGSDGQVYLLTAAHCTGRIVFSCEVPGAVGNWFLQPSPLDGGVYPNDVVGQVAWVSNITSFETDVDLGAILPVSGTDVEPLVAGLNIGFSGDYLSQTPSLVGLRVAKSGRTTGVTYGEVVGTYGVVKVDYSSCGQPYLKNVIVTTKMIEQGDSGSPLVTPTGDFVGVFVATTDKLSFAVPADKVVGLGYRPMKFTPEKTYTYQFNV